MAASPMRTVITSITCLLTVIAVFCGTGASAQNAAAIVEAVDAPSTSLEIMDMLEQGQVIKLKPGEKITIGYLKSCAVETVTGGTITVGELQSGVDDGTVERKSVYCDVGQFRVSQAQSQEAGAAVFRKPASKSKGKKRSKPDVVLYGTSPVVSITAANAVLVITPMGSKDAAVRIDMEPGLHDLHEKGLALEPGLLYTAEAGGRILVIKISPLAEPGRLSVISRYVAL